jgi:two-component system, NtrC family, nitrogen regulation sensor histidine kinase NtrY
MARWWQTREGQPSLPVDEMRRRRRELVILAVTAVVFLLFAVFETRLPRFGNSASEFGNIIFFLLINLNIILLILFVFLVTRNLTKLIFERRRGIFGSRLRTRLVVAFFALSLVPSTLLFFVAEGFLTAAFDTWFNVRVESSLEGSLDVAQSYYQFAANNALHFADEAGRQAKAKDLLGASRRAALQRFVDAKRAEFDLAGLEVFTADRTSIARSDGADVGLGAPAESPDIVAELLRGEEVAITIPFGRSDIVRTGVPVRADDGTLLGAVTVDYLVPRNVSQTARNLSRAYHEYRQLASMKQPIKNGYIMTLALITLVVIFCATWFGFRQAKNITTPLQLLAEGTREVAQGNYQYKIEAGNDEEVAVLVDSFNQMTADLQQVNSELVERRKYLENILANIGAGVVSLSQAGAVTMLNRAAEQMLGLRFVEVRGKHWSTVLQRAELRKVGGLISEAMATPDREVEQQVTLVGGEHIVTAHVTATSLCDDAGVRRGTMLFFEDVTHLLRVQRMEAWREVARRLAHEIKNPLTPIQLSAQRLRKRYAALLTDGDGNLFDECTGTIVRQVDELKRLVNEFSTFARLPVLSLQPQEINAVIEEALALYREAHPEIAFALRAGTDLPLVELDREAIKRALINMLDNAVTACQGAAGGGRIEIVTSLVTSRRVVRVEVADNGVGMSSDVKLRLFEPYFSTKKDGSGLGLAIVSAILADHQAYIRVQDNVPHGSRFVIDFPVRRRSETDQVAATA